MTPSQDDLSRMKKYAQTRDPEALSALIQRHQPALLAHTRQILRNTALAQDVTQDTFVRLMQTSRPPTSCVIGWLRKVARQMALDTLRSNAARRQREKSYGIALLDRGESTDISTLLNQTLAQLPDHARTLIDEHYLQQRTLRDMAADRHISPATMMRQVHAATDILRNRLTRQGVVIPTAVVSTMLMTHFAVAASHEAIATTASTLLAMKITSALAVPVMTASLASQFQPASSGLSMPASLHIQQMETAAHDLADQTMARIILHQSKWAYVPHATLMDESSVLFYKPLARPDAPEVIVLTGQFDRQVWPTQALRNQLRHQTGQPVKLLVQPDSHGLPHEPALP